MISFPIVVKVVITHVVFDIWGIGIYNFVLQVLKPFPCTSMLSPYVIVMSTSSSVYLQLVSRNAT
jgi:hypothetical protein